LKAALSVELLAVLRAASKGFHLAVHLVSLLVALLVVQKAHHLVAPRACAFLP
jgi:Tfp pilus assembly protein PilX